MRLSRLLLCLVFFAFACSGGDETPDAPDADTTAADAPTGDAPADTPEATPAAEATPAPPAFLAAAHILVQYAGSMRAKPTVTRTKEEALARASEAITKLNAGGAFADLAKEYSDGPSAPKGGDLGSFPPNRMIPEFSAALLKAEVGKIVPEPVETAFGYHVILRNEASTFRASHILFQYKGSMRAKPTVTRTKEESKALADDVLAKAKDGGDFAALAKEHSDGPSGPKGGDLGVFPGGAMHPDFEAGVVSVKPGALVPEPVETPFGYHLILRVE
jgi:parvulin-like peptidyl-prolyl isomerase